MASDDEPDAAEILRALEAIHREVATAAGEGLRERKKRQLRQRISDTATAMFLTRGFEEVTVSEIAAACDVSEQTVFNYFPTKEGMFFDRIEGFTAQLAETVRERDGRALVDAIVDLLLAPERDARWHGLDEARALQMFRLFGDTIERSPTLTAGQNANLAELVDIVATALAERVGAQPDDPDVEVAAVIVLGLTRTRSRSTFRHLRDVDSFAELDAAVHRDVLSAARIVAPSLEAFDSSPPAADGLRLVRPREKHSS